MTTTGRQTRAQARKSALDSEFAALYAVAGLADTIAARAKTSLIEARTKTHSRSTALEARAKSGVGELTTLLATLPEQFSSLPEITWAKLAGAQRSARGLAADASSGYATLAVRGKRVFDDARIVVAEVAERMDPAFERVQETVTVARQRVTGHTPTDTVTSRSAAQAAAHRAAKRADDEATAREAAARKVAVKKATARAAAKQATAAEQVTAGAPAKQTAAAGVAKKTTARSA